MSAPSAAGPRLLLIVGPASDAATATTRARRAARDLAAGADDPVGVAVRVVATRDGTPAGDAARAGTRAEGIEATLADELADVDGVDPSATDVATLRADAGCGADLADAVLERLADEPADRVVAAPDGWLPADRLRERVGRSDPRVAADGGRVERRRLVHPGGPRRLLAVFGLSYLFYLALGGFSGGLDLLTGAVSAAVVAAALSGVAFSEPPALRRTGARLLRFVAFLPVLLWEVAKANAVVAYVILHPRLPIDPSTRVVETGTREGLERMVLANSVTLTPGTLTVDVEGRAFTVHSLTASGHRDVEAGRLERLVSWVFHGRGGDEPAEAGGDGGA